MSAPSKQIIAGKEFTWSAVPSAKTPTPPRSAKADAGEALGKAREFAERIGLPPPSSMGDYAAFNRIFEAIALIAHYSSAAARVAELGRLDEGYAEAMAGLARAKKHAADAGLVISEKPTRQQRLKKLLHTPRTTSRRRRGGAGVDRPQTPKHTDRDDRIVTVGVRAPWGSVVQVELDATDRDRDIAARHRLPLATVVVARLRSAPHKASARLPDKPGHIVVDTAWNEQIYAAIEVIAADKERAKRVIGTRPEDFAALRLKKEQTA